MPRTCEQQIKTSCKKILTANASENKKENPLNRHEGKSPRAHSQNYRAQNSNL